MNYEDYKDKVGERFTFSYGEIVASDTGEVEVTTFPKVNSIYVSHKNKKAQVIVDPKIYIGRQWKLYTSDCVSVAAEYVDDHVGTSLKMVRPKKVYDQYFKLGVCQWFEDNNFLSVAVDDIQENDFVVYMYEPDVITHTAAYVGNGKILHHLPKKYSSIDLIEDYSKVLGVYRAN